MNAIYTIPAHPCRPSWGIAMQQLTLATDYASTAPCGVCGNHFDIMPSHPYKLYCSKQCGQVASYNNKKDREREAKML